MRANCFGPGAGLLEPVRCLISHHLICCVRPRDAKLKLISVLMLRSFRSVFPFIHANKDATSAYPNFGMMRHFWHLDGTAQQYPRQHGATSLLYYQSSPCGLFGTAKEVVLSPCCVNYQQKRLQASGVVSWHCHSALSLSVFPLSVLHRWESHRPCFIPLLLFFDQLWRATPFFLFIYFFTYTTAPMTLSLRSLYQGAVHTLAWGM